MCRSFSQKHLNCVLTSQVKGHLDYMRQMDTILVAVGVPTKEVAGASMTPLQTLIITKETVDTPEQAPNEEVTQRQNLKCSQDGSCTQEGGDMRAREETEETGDGWDIPDISDLLDSLNNTDGETEIGDNLPLVSKENTTKDDTASALNTQCDGVQEADPDCEHTSWSWDDTHWTTEHTHRGSPTCAEHVTGPAASM